MTLFLTWGRRNVKEHFSGLAREFDGQIKEATVREAENVTRWPSLGSKSYFSTEAVVLLLHALRLISRYY